MKKINVELIFDDRGHHYYYVDGLNLSPYMYFLYKTLNLYEIKKNTSKKALLETDKYDKKIISYKEELDNLLKKDNNALVGPFFYIDEQIYVKTKKIGEFDPKLSIFNNDIEHSEWFYNELNKQLDYDNYLRGRVIYDNENNYFKIFANPAIVINNTIHKKILELFNINENKVILFLADEC